MARRVGLALGVALGLALLLIAALFAFAQTGAGKRLIVAQLERELAAPGTTVRAAGLEGLLPFDLRLDELSFAGADGVWLEVEGLRLSWSPAALLRARLQIDELSAELIRVLRPPPAVPEDGDDEPFRLPELPETVPPVVLERLAVDRIELAPAVLGEPAAFTLSGRLAAGEGGRSAVLALAAERLDEPTAQAALEARLELDPAALELALSAVESGGLLAALSDRPEAGDFRLELSGAGPLDGWSGTLELEAERLASAAARLDVALADQPSVRLDGSLRPDPALLPDHLAPLVGERLGLALTLTQTGAQQLLVEDLRAEIAAATLAGRAALDFEQAQFSTAAELTVPDLAPLSALAATPLAGGLRAELAAEGLFARPEGTLELALSAPAVDDLAAERIETTLDFAVIAPQPDQLALEISGAGRAQDLRLPGEVPLPAQDLAWQLDVSAVQGGGVTVRELALGSEDLELQVTGSIDPQTLAGEAEIGVGVSALAPLTAPFGQRIAGEVSLDADLRVAAGAEQVEIDLRGRAEDLAGLPPGLAELLGPAPRLSALAELSPERRLEVSSLTLEGAAASLGGEIALTLPEQALAGKITLVLPRLAELAPALGQELAGALEIEASPGGTLEAPTVALALRGRNLVLAGQPVDDLVVETAARDLLTAPSGELEAALELAGLEASLATGFRLQDQTLRLADLRLGAPRTSVEGDLTIDLERTLVEGELSGAVADLVAFAPLLPVRLRGELGFEVRLEPADQSQTVALAVDGQQLLSDFGRLRRLQLSATVSDALGTPRVDADLELGQFRRDAITLEQAALTAEGTLDGLALTLALEGEALQPFTLAARGELAVGDAIRLRLEQLDGELAGEPLRLATPAELSVAEAIRLAGLDLRLSDARLQASAELGPREVTAEVALDALPLALLSSFGAPPLAGEASAELRLSGAAANPRATLDLSVDDLRARNLAFAELPPAELAVAAELVDRRLSVDLRGEGVTEEPLTLTAELPLIVRFDDFAFELPDDGRLDGRLDAEFALARLAALAGLDDQTLTGLLRADVALSGTVGAPEVVGALAVADGAYANGATGTVLHDLTLDVEASARQVVIERFAATDGGGGSLRGEGEIALDPAADYPVDLRVELDDARLVRRDDVDATFSGGLELGGTVAALSLGGELTIDRAEIRIPDEVGPSVAVIEVEEIGVDGREVRAGDAAGGAPTVDLALAVDIPGQVFVRGRGLESEWQGELQVAGTASEPVLTGTLQLKRGYIDFLDRRLQLRQGLITFSGESPPDPQVMIEATAEVGDLTAIVRVEGRARQPSVTLASEPPLPQDEVLAQLLFNRNASEMTPAQAAQLALALNRLRGGGGLDIMGKVRSLLGVDTLDVGGGGAPGEGTVRAGKYLNEDVYIELESGLGEQTGRASVEVEILPNVSVEAETGQDAQSGVGVKWRYDY